VSKAKEKVRVVVNIIATFPDLPLKYHPWFVVRFKDGTELLIWHKDIRRIPKANMKVLEEFWGAE
jgi:hypothetical protein